MLQQCAGKVVRLGIQFEITYSTTVFEFNTATALVVLRKRCNFVNAGTEKVNSYHFIGNSRGSALTLLMRASWSSGLEASLSNVVLTIHERSKIIT